MQLSSSGGHWLLIIAMLVGYFLPSIIAKARRHKNGVPIFLVNLTLGWTVLGWLVALIWSFTSNFEPREFREQMGWKGTLAIFVTVVALLLAGAHLFGTQRATSAPSAAVAGASQTPTPAVAPSEPASKWKYDSKADEMRGVTNRWASLLSENKAQVDGETSLEIQLRNMPGTNGQDALFVLRSGRFDCTSSGCKVSLKFDDTAIVEYDALPAQLDGRAALYLQFPDSYIRRLVDSHRLFVEVPLARGRTEQFRFTTAGLAWP